MKSAYELAMERLNKQSPDIKLTATQKARLADLESRHKARVAEREIGLGDAITAAMTQGNFEEADKLKQQLTNEKKKLADELEEQKEAVRRSKG